MTRTKKQHPTASHFRHAGSLIIKNSKKLRSVRIQDRRFRQHFGTTPEICAEIWERLNPLETIEKEFHVVQIYHLLWALIFMKLYTKESIHASLVGGVNEKTFCKWTWIFVEAISLLEFDLVSSYMHLTFLYTYDKS